MFHTQHHHNVVFQHPITRHLFSSMETDGLWCGLDYKMFTRKMLSLHVSAQLAILRCFNCQENVCPLVMMVADFKIDSHPFHVYMLV
jgi:hypothetical protein